MVMMYFVETCTEFGRFVQRSFNSYQDAYYFADILCKQLMLDVVVTNEFDCIVKRFNVK